MKKAEFLAFFLLITIGAGSIFGLILWASAATTSSPLGAYVQSGKEQITIAPGTQGRFTASKYQNQITGAIISDYAYVTIVPTSGGMYVTTDETAATNQNPEFRAGERLSMSGFLQLKGFRGLPSGSTSTVLSVLYYKWQP